MVYTGLKSFPYLSPWFYYYFVIILYFVSAICLIVLMCICSCLICNLYFEHFPHIIVIFLNISAYLLHHQPTPLPTSDKFKYWILLSFINKWWVLLLLVILILILCENLRVCSILFVKTCFLILKIRMKMLLCNCWILVLGTCLVSFYVPCIIKWKL